MILENKLNKMLNFDRNQIIIGHLQADIAKLESKLTRYKNSVRTYKGHKTKRMLKNVK